MVLVENLIIKGTYFYPVKFNEIYNLKDTIRAYLIRKMYEPENILPSIFFKDRFLTATFRLSFGKFEPSFILRAKKALGFLTDEQMQTKWYFEKLANKRSEVPIEVKIWLSLQKLNGVDGISIEIKSIPAVYYQVCQMNRNLHLDKTDYSRIWHENSEFIKEVMAAINAKVTSEPKPLSQYVTSELSDKLMSFNFKKEADLLIKGKTNLELGKEAVGDLLGVIENFLYTLILKLKEKPAELHQPEKNITKLKTLGFLSDKTEGVIKSSLYNSVYRKLKDIDHKKEHLNYFDLTLYYGITETIVDYLLDLTLKYKIRCIEKKEL